MNFANSRGKYTARDVDEESDLQPLNGASQNGMNGSHVGSLGVERTVGLAKANPKCTVNWANLAIGVLVLISVGLIITLATCKSSKTDVIITNDDGNLLLSFLVIGDWGRQGDFNQTETSAAMAVVAEKQKPNFVISTGDNFYPHGLNSTLDMNFDLSFRNIYSHEFLKVDWYSVLGNHDYGDGSDDAEQCLAMEGGCPISPLHQLSVELNKRDRRWHCARTYTVSFANGTVDIFFMDTTPFIQRYRDETWAKYHGGILQQSWEAQLLELEAMFARSLASWKILVGHHPVRSNGEHGDTQELVVNLQPLLEKYGVRVAFHGHDHDLEHIHESNNPVHFVVSGAGSKCRNMTKHTDAHFQHDTSGFVFAALKKEEMVLQYYGIDDSAPLYTTTIPRHMNATGW